MGEEGRKGEEGEERRGWQKGGEEGVRGESKARKGGMVHRK